MKQKGQTALGLGLSVPACTAVNDAMVPKACSFIRAGAWSSHLLGRFCFEMEQNVKLLRLSRS